MAADDGGEAAAAGSFFFNTKEIDTVQYEVRITADPVLSAEHSSNAANQMTMVNKFGQKYRCLLPPETLVDKAGEDGGNGRGEGGGANGEETDGQSSTELSTDNLKRLLSPMATEPCLIRTKDWWSYELCHNQHVRQFHIEGKYVEIRASL